MADNMRDRDQKGRGARVAISQELQREIRELRASGHTVYETARLVGCGKNAVLKYGGGMPGRKLRHVLAATEAKECVRLRELGWEYKAIALHLDISGAAAWVAVNKPDVRRPEEPPA